MIGEAASLCEEVNGSGKVSFAEGRVTELFRVQVPSRSACEVCVCVCVCVYMCACTCVRHGSLQSHVFNFARTCTNTATDVQARHRAINSWRPRIYAHTRARVHTHTHTYTHTHTHTTCTWRPRTFPAFPAATHGMSSQPACAHCRAGT